MTPAPPRPCSFLGCDLKHKARGLCHGHYEQRRRGKPLTALKKQTPKYARRALMSPLWPLILLNYFKRIVKDAKGVDQ